MYMIERERNTKEMGDSTQRSVFWNGMGIIEKSISCEVRNAKRNESVSGRCHA
jgi:hypothetical protein